MITNVLLNKEDFLKKIKETSLFSDISFPDLKDFLNIDYDPVLRIKTASLDDHFLANSIGEITKLKIIQAISKIKTVDIDNINDFFDFEKHSSGLMLKTIAELIIFKRCVVSPNFSYDESLKILEMFPEVINKVVKIALKGN